MNRHARRAAAKQLGASNKPPVDLPQMMGTLASLEEFGRMAERLKPHLEELELLAEKLNLANDALAQAKAENSALRAELALQREIFLRLFASGMGISVDQVLSMEAAIQEQLSAEISDATTSPGTSSTDTKAHQGP